MSISRQVQRTRRSFLKAAGAGLVLGIGWHGARLANAALPASFAPNAFLQIGSDGSIVLFSKNPDIGQGVKTALPQIVAEELDVDWQQVEVRQGALDLRFGSQFMRQAAPPSRTITLRCARQARQPGPC
ncbi:molybdopterin-dependent oxidoreductase [Massilia sp. H-1]|nr:molybdopterin-dependent oxidoreductase [Massilia sp. H-1]